MSLPSTITSAPRTLIIHTDGGSRGNPGPAATGIVVYDSAGHLIHQFGRFIGVATNNDAEYLAVIDALGWVVAHEPTASLSFRLDSQLVVEQLRRHWQIKEPRLLELAASIWHLLESHRLQATFTHIPRAQNTVADKEVNRVLDNEKLK